MRLPAKVLVAALAVMTIAAPTALIEGSEASAAPLPSWRSGASGYGVSTDSIAHWRGHTVDIAGTWADNSASSAENLWQLQKGGTYANWAKPMDIAVGGIFSGETWSKAAAGDYDQRWAASLKNLASLRKGDGVTYIRFAHEMNGNWYPWQVNSNNYVDFMTAWKRYRALQVKLFPTAKLVFNVNRESIGTGMAWTKFFPGKAYVDAISVDYYNNYPYVDTAAQWTASLDQTDQWGAPKGLNAHRLYAQSQGVYMGISEWSGNAGFGDSPAFVNGLLSYVKANAGWRPGQIWWDILFNVEGYGGDFSLYGSDVKMPMSASAYRSFFLTLN